MRRALCLAALAASGCWDFESLSNGDASAARDGSATVDLAASDGAIPDLALLDLTPLPDLTRLTLGFAPANVLADEGSPTGLAVADFNQDQHLDFAVLSATVHSVAVFLGDGTGNFATSMSEHFLLGSGINLWLGAGDLYGQGHADLVVPEIATLQGDGKGGFTVHPWSSQSFAPPSALGDFNGDQKLDVIAGDKQFVHLFVGDGAGTFTMGASFAAGATTLDLVAADFDGDGHLDLAQADGDATLGGVVTLYNQGNGVLAQRQTFTSVHAIQALAAADLDRDGDLDLVAVSSADDQTLTLLNSNGVLATNNDRHAVGAGPRSLALGDLDGDGVPDLVVASHDEGMVNVLLGDKITFQKAVKFDPGGMPGRVALADVDHDGRLDILVVLPEGNSVSILLNTSK